MTSRERKPFALDLVTAAVLVGAFAATAVVYDRLPDPIPTHFDLNGRANGWMPRAIGAWCLPVLAVGVVGLLRFGSHLLPSGWRERLEASPIRIASLATAAVLTSTHVLILRASLSAVHHLGSAIWVVVGGLFVVLGLILPRTRRNPFFGVRTAFALASEENWARTQRVGGYSMTLGGLVTLFAGLVGSPAAALAAILVSGLVPILWSWIIARRGTGSLPPMSR
jgi:uncharacterized membrane protein